jgi:beta-glucosidase
MKIQNILLAIAVLVPSGMKAQNITLNAKNIDKVIKAMTLEEKAHLITGGTDASFKGFENRKPRLWKHVEGCAGTTSTIPRLGIPNTVLADGPCGVRIAPHRDGTTQTFFATAFPVGTAMAATWNTDLVTEAGKAFGNEILEYGCDIILGPGLNLHRNPLCGRNFEYYSEDPLLTGKIAAASIRGIQTYGVGACAKHFAANSQEDNRLQLNEVVSQRALRELYLKGFEIAVKEGKPWALMSSYNKLNGPYTQENHELLTTLLRDEWHYNGIVMTDWIDGRNTPMQVHAGNDVLEYGTDVQYQEIIDNAKSGKLKMEDIDKAVRRVLEYVVHSSHFRGYQYSSHPDLEAHAALTRKVADECIVLLKNVNGALPFTQVDTVALFGAQSYDLMACGCGAATVNVGKVVNVSDGLRNAGITITDDLAALYAKNKECADLQDKISHPDGNWYWRLGRAPYPNFSLSEEGIEAQAKKSDIAVITLGHQSREGIDRRIHGDQGYNFTDAEKELIKNVCTVYHKFGKKVVVVINAGCALETTSWRDQPDAILMAWQPGVDGGDAIVDILTGKVNPSAKSPMTWPLDIMDEPSTANFPLGDGRNTTESLHKEGIKIGYRYFNTAKKAVAFPFGFGLSYTSFKYSNPTVKAVKGGFRATITVENTGKVAGKEAVQVYVSAPKGNIDKPENELKAFAKTRLLNPGESQTLTFNVTDYELASFHEDGSCWISDQGDYKVRFAASVEDARAEGTYTLKKAFMQKVNDILKPNKPL